MAVLGDLNWRPMWVSLLGCIKGCLDYLGVDVTDAWLYGASGYAFVINIHEELCPSGPTAWRTERAVELAQNVGCSIRRITAHRSEASFAQVQHIAWTDVCRALDQDEPCYGWEMDLPEYYVIHGYDEAGYLFKGPRCESGAGPLPWRALGGSELGWLEVGLVNVVQAASEKHVVRQALEFALDHAAKGEKWSFDKYRTGLEGFELWIDALKNNVAGGAGAAYNAAVWSECRRHAAAFLDLARERLEPSLAPLFAEAAECYRTVSDQLAQVSQLFPFMGLSDEEMEEHVADERRRGEAVDALQISREAEERGLGALAEISNALDEQPSDLSGE
jgi:hypothetical protein